LKRKTEFIIAKILAIILTIAILPIAIPAFILLKIIDLFVIAAEKISKKRDNYAQN